MANPNDKTGNFLNAIQKYADEQKHKIESEVERFKREELKKAEDEGLKDAYVLIQKEMGAMRIGISSEMAKREEKSKQALYQKRPVSCLPLPKQTATRSCSKKARRKLQGALTSTPVCCVSANRTKP